MNNEDRNLIAKQHCNKLIAEFMGAEPDKKTFFRTGEHVYLYHASWDWLMPVISKIETVGRGWFPHELHTSLMKNDIDNAYDTVVEFIKEYNG